MYGWGKLPQADITKFIENVAASLDLGDSETLAIVKRVEQFFKKREKGGGKPKKEADLPVLPKTRVWPALPIQSMLLPTPPLTFILLFALLKPLYFVTFTTN